MSVRRLWTAALIASLIIAARPAQGQLAAGGWPKFRGDARNTGLAVQSGPDTAALAWTFVAGGAVPSSPCVGSDGAIYFSALDGYLYCVSPDGTLRWRYGISNSTSYSSPAVDAAGVVYVGSDDFFLYAINPNGTLKWRRGFGAKILGSPAVGGDGKIYIGTWQSKFHALSPVDGTVLWTYTAGNPIVSSGAIDASGNLYFTCKDGYLYSLNPSGALRWRYRTFNYLDSSPAVGPDGVVYFGGYDGYLYAVNPGGTLKWRYNAGSPVKSSPAIGPDGTVFVGADNGRLYAVAPDGSLRWSYQTGGAVQSSPAVGSDGTVFVGSMDGYLYAITANGSLLWRHSLGGPVFSSPAIAEDGSLYIGCDAARLFAFSKDRTPPTLPQVTDDGEFTTTADTLRASWWAEDPETGVVEYKYAVGTSPGAADVVVWTSAGSATGVTLTGLGLLNGATYYFSVKARNGAHLWSDAGYSDGITVDSTAPSVPVVTDSGRYTSSLTTLQASWTSVDPESGVAEYEYAVGSAPGQADVRNWTSTGATAHVDASGLALSDGGTYYFAVRARNRAGLWSPPGFSDGITVDATPPSIPVVLDDGAFTASSSTLSASWHSSDAQSGIVEYVYALGTAPGASDIRGWTSAGNDTQVTVGGLSLADGQRCYFAVRAINGAGSISNTGVSDGITVDLTPPSVPAVEDEGEYSVSSESLSASWFSADPQSGISEYQYAVGTSPGSTDVRGWSSAGTSNQVTAAGLALQDGVVYYFAVRARNGAGMWSAVGFSDGIIVDASPPSVPVVTDDGEFTPSSETLHAAWGAQDPHTGVVEYRVALGTAPGASDVLGWASAGSQTELTFSNLTLTNGGRYYFSVQAKNAAGLWSGTGSSDGIVVDTTAPVPPLVIDDGVYTADNTSLHASWSAADPESGVAEYIYAVGTSPGTTDVVSWTSAGSQTGVHRTGLLLVDGVTYYFLVRARNRAGLWSAAGISDGITVDTSAPGAPVVTDDGQFTSSATTLKASWRAQDAESGISEFQYAIGTSPGAVDVCAWTSAGTAAEVEAIGLSLVDGQSYYFAVRARNGAGLWSAVGVSDGITVDASPPAVPVVTDDGAYSPSHDTLHAVWSSHDPHSGVVEYQYAIGTAPGAADLVAWTSAGAAGGVSRAGLPLNNGSTYYFAVRARNGAGAWSGVGTSDGILVDWTPPLTPSVAHESQFTSSTTTLSASWTAQDPQSGVTEIQYAIGTVPGGTDTVGWTSVGTQTQVVRSGLTLSHGQTYYFAVRARNPLGMWSQTGVSGGVKVDTTAPAAPQVIDDGDETASFDSLHASWSAYDPESGVTEFTYAVGTSPGADDVVGWTSAGSSLEVTVYGLSLVEGAVYYFSVRARNGAGLWGPAGHSDGIAVSAAVSWPRFRGDAKNRGFTSAIGCSSGRLAWEFVTQGWVESSAAIAGDGTVYFGSGDGSMYAVNRTGSLLWRYETGGPIDSSPAIGKGGRIYFGSYDGYLYCLNPNGTLRWRYRTGDQIWSSPLIGPDDVVYIGSQDGYLYAVRDTGQLKWRFNAGGAVWSSPALDDGVIYFGSGDGYIYAVYASSGVRKWRYYTGTAVDSSPAVGLDGTIYAGSGDGYFYAIRPDGTLRWRYYVGWGAVDSSAAVAADGTIYVGAGHDLNYGFLYAFTPSGSLKWMFDAQGGVRSSPSVGGDGTVYFGSGDGHVYAVTSTGQLKWRYQTGWAVFGSPAIGRDGAVFVGSFSGHLYAFKDSNVVDPTPPGVPVVKDEGAATVSTSTLSAWWSSSDPESGISGYMFAIGTSPGASDVLGWTSTGTAANVTKSGLSLQVGRVYYVSVRARNGAGLWSQTGSSNGILVVSPECLTGVGEARGRPDGSLVFLKDKIMTARFGDLAYVQEQDRSAGIKVEGISVGEPPVIIGIAGTLATSGCERAIVPITIELGNAVPVPAPIMMSCRDAGSWVARASGQQENGACSSGLFAAVCGRVISVDSSGFLINDGSVPGGLRVGFKGSEPSGGWPAVAPGFFVRVAGVSSSEPFDGGYRPVVLIRSSADVRVLSP